MDNLIHMAIPNKKNDHTKRYGRIFFKRYFIVAVYLLR